MKKQIIQNIGSNYIYRIMGMVLGFFLIPFLIHKLGKVSFGIIVLAESLIVFCEVLTQGVRMGLARHATYALSKKNHREFQEYLGTGKGILLVAALLVLIVGSIVSFLFPSLFHVPPEFEQPSRILFILINIAFVLTIPNILYWAVLYSHRKFDFINLASSIGLVVRALAIFILFSVLSETYINMTTYGIIYFFMRVVENTIVYRFCRYIEPGLKIILKDFRKERVKEILSFSIHVTVSRISSLLYENTSNVLINLFWGPVMNAMYAVSLKIPNILKKIFQESAWTLSPIFTDLAARDEKEKFKKLYFMYTKFTTILVTPISLFVIIFSGPIIKAWMGEGFEFAAQVMVIHMVPLLAIIPLAVAGCPNTAYAKVKIPSRMSLASAVLNVAIGVVLAKVFDFGIMSFAIASSICTVLYSAIFIPIYSGRIANIPFKEYYVRAFLYPLITAYVIIGSYFAYLYVMGHEISLSISNIIIFLILVVIYVGVTYIANTEAIERQYVHDFFIKFKRKLNFSA